MERLIPWKQLTRQIQKHYPKAGNGRKPYPLEVMLRVHCMQLFYNLSDPMMEDTLYEVDSVRRFCGLSLSGAIPDESIILKFRHLLEDHDLGTKLFKTINKVLDREGLMLREGTIVDASLVAAPTSTKNKDGKRDPEMHQTKKGNEWHFGILFPCLFSEKHEDSHAVKLTVEYPYLIVLLDDTSYIRPCSPSMRIIPGYSDNMVSLITSAAAQQAIAAEARL